MFGNQRQYNARIKFKRYQSYTKNLSALRNFVKTIFHDPSDQVGLKEVLRNTQRVQVIHIRVKEKGAKLLQKMQDKGQLDIIYIESI